MTAAPCWRIGLTATAGVFKAFEETLETFCDAVTCLPLADDDSIWRVTGFASAAPDRDALHEALAATAAGLGVSAPGVDIETVAETDWAVRAFASFPPVRVGRYVIYGSHETEPPPGALALRLDAGPAFGTGEHASTAGVLWALDRLARNFRVRRALDMGTGSAILAMAVAKTWRARVVACDVDPHAVATAAANVRGNGLAGLIAVHRTDGYRAPAVAAGAPYDLIVGNILADPLCAMAGDLARHLAPGGYAVLAGFLHKDARRVLAAHRERGLVYRFRWGRDGWVTLVLRKTEKDV